MFAETVRRETIVYNYVLPYYDKGLNIIRTHMLSSMRLCKCGTKTEIWPRFDISVSMNSNVGTSSQRSYAMLPSAFTASNSAPLKSTFNSSISPDDITSTEDFQTLCTAASFMITSHFLKPYCAYYETALNNFFKNVGDIKIQHYLAFYLQLFSVLTFINHVLLVVSK